MVGLGKATTPVLALIPSAADLVTVVGLVLVVGQQDKEVVSLLVLS